METYLTVSGTHGSLTSCSPFIWETIVFVLHDLVIMKGYADDEGTDESEKGGKSVSMRNKRGIDLDQDLAWL